MTNFGFKRLFKTSSNKDILIAFLNDLFNGREVVTDLENYPSAYPDDSEVTGNVIFNVLCSTEEGEQIAVQMERTMESDIRQRILHSGCKLLVDYAGTDRRVSAKRAYVVVFMDMVHLAGSEDKTKYIHDICLKYRDDSMVFSNGIGFYFIELINFNKKESELENDLDRWLYYLKNMHKLDGPPDPIIQIIQEIFRNKNS